MLSDGSEHVRRANKASSDELALSLGLIGESRTKVVHASELSTKQTDEIWELYESNMRALYFNSSLGWKPRKKRKELFDKLARYILLFSGDQSTIIAYTGFRFEHEDGEDLLYCYELQVAASHKRIGLGRQLMGLLGKLAKNMRMEKIMLTVLHKNETARKFYAQLQFVQDACSPDEDEADYSILSRTIDS